MKLSKIIFLCSPSTGCIDTCAPVVEKLAEKTGASIEIIIPKIELLGQLTLNPAFEKILCSWQGNMLVTTAGGTLNISLEKLPHIVRDLKEKHLRPCYSGQIIKIHFAVQAMAFSVPAEKYGGHKFVPDETSTNDQVVIIGDLLELSKPYMAHFATHLRGAKFFSINHGIDIDLRDDFPNTEILFPKEDCLCFLFSELEVPYYKSRFNIEDENIAVVGVQKHDPVWQKRLQAIMGGMAEGIGKKDVLLIGRPHGLSYLRRQDKARYLADINDILVEKMGYRIVLKRHPKENDLSIYRNAFGPEGKSWIVSDSPLNAIAAETDFAVSFYSGACTDLIRIGKPVIEYNNITNEDVSSDINLKRMPNGNLALSYEYFGLVLPASDRSSFADQVSLVVEQPAAALKQLGQAYRQAFNDPQDSIEKTIQHIRARFASVKP